MAIRGDSFLDIHGDDPSPYMKGMSVRQEHAAIQLAALDLLEKDLLDTATPAVSSKEIARQFGLE